jgi:carboxyl-terminal processing protease
MKNFLLIAFFIIPLVSRAQVFDSLAYQQHYNKRFEAGWYGDPLDINTRIAGLSRAWAEARWNFANFDLVPHHNWDSLYHAFIPRVTESANSTNYYKELMRFYQHLNDGHSLIFAPEKWRG